MRRRTAAAIAMMAAACLLLSGCGGVGASSERTTTPPPTATSSSPPSPTTGTTSAPAPSTPSFGTGVYGYVTAGPTCPVEREDQPCPPHPVATVVQARTASGVTVGSTETDSDGRYALDLAPGSYSLAVAGPTWPRCPTTPITVRAGSLVRVDISCDTGIR